MPLNGRRQTFRAEDAATAPIGVSPRVRDHIFAERRPAETVDDALRRLLGIEPRQPLQIARK